MVGPGPTVEIRGADTLAATLDHAAGELDGMAAVGSTASLVASGSRGRAPVLTGALAASISGTADENVATVTAGAGAYAGVQHWGWAGHNITASLFLLRTAYDTETVWVGYFERDVNEILGRVRGI